MGDASSTTSNGRIAIRGNAPECASHSECATIGGADFVLEPTLKRKRFAGYEITRDGKKLGTELTVEAAKEFAVEQAAKG
jgi:hypothetical protein